MKTATRDIAGTTTRPGVGRAVAIFGSLAASVIHFAATPAHYSEWWAAGVFFALIGLLQAGWALAAMLTSGRVVFGAGLVLNVGVLAVWAMSRTVGMPIGPSAGIPEEIGRAGLTAVVFEVTICLVALHHLLRRRHASGMGAFRWEFALIGAAGAIATALAMPAVGAAMSHSHSHAPSETADPHESDEEGGHEHGEESQGTGTDAEPSQSPGTPAPSPSDQQTSTSEDGHHDDEPHDH